MYMAWKTIFLDDNIIDNSIETIDSVESLSKSQ